MIRVVIVDDQALVREGLRALLSRADDIEVVGEAADGNDAVRVVERTEPDVVLMDIRMPGTDGITATRRILGASPSTRIRVVVLTTFDSDDNILDAIGAGARRRRPPRGRPRRPGGRGSRAAAARRARRASPRAARTPTPRRCRGRNGC